MTAELTPEARAELTPTGLLRVGINHSNFLLSRRDPETGAYAGIVIDIAAELAARLGVAFQPVGYENPGSMANAATAEQWDIAFMGSEPARANVIAFSAAYLEIDAGYLVRAESPITRMEEVDRPGVRIALMDRSAYHLYLERHIKQASFVCTASIDGSFEAFVAQDLEVLAGLKPRLIADQRQLPGSRILEGRFTAIQQSVGTPRLREHAARYLHAFTEELKASGFVAAAIARHGVQGVSVAAAAA